MTSERRKELELLAMDGIKPIYTPFRQSSEMLFYIAVYILSIAKRKSVLPVPLINTYINRVASQVEAIELDEKIFEHQSKINVEFEKLMLENKDLKSKSKEELIKLIDQMYKLHLGLK